MVFCGHFFCVALVISIKYKLYKCGVAGGAFNVLMGFVSFVPNKKKAWFRYSFLFWCRIHFADKAVPHFADKLLYLGFSFIIWSLNYNWVSKRWLTIMNISFYFLLSFLFTIEWLFLFVPSVYAFLHSYKCSISISLHYSLTFNLLREDEECFVTDSFDEKV